MKIKDSLIKRNNVYNELTDEMLTHYENALVRAIRMFAKTDTDIRVIDVYLYPKNNNFVVHILKVDVKVGDKIRDTNGNVVVVTEQNIDKVVTNELNVILSNKVLEEGTAVDIYTQLKFIDDFIKEYGEDHFYNLLNDGIESFDDMKSDKHVEILEKLTDPIEDIVKELDDLQKVQYNLFINNKERRIH